MDSVRVHYCDTVSESYSSIGGFDMFEMTNHLLHFTNSDYRTRVRRVAQNSRMGRRISSFENLEC